MDIEYNKAHSSFVGPCEDAIREERASLDAGQSIRVIFDKSGGYDEAVVVAIRDGDHSFFGSNWEGRDPTRFPARVKAAATALLNCGCYGRYLIEHQDGALAIRLA
jgi:hypothetical protein